jgi:hypothetical protein
MSSEETELNVNTGVESDKEGVVFKAIRQKGSVGLSLETFHQNLLKRFANIQEMFDHLPDVYLAKSEEGAVSVKTTKIDLDGDIDHNTKDYFGIHEDFNLDVYSFQDKDGAVIAALRVSANPDGTIQVSLINNNPQPGTEESISSSLSLITNKEGKASLSWNGARIANSAGSTKNSIPASGSSNVEVTFDTSIVSYTSAPIVTITPMCSASAAGSIFAVVTSVSATGFKATVKNTSSSAVDVTLNWAAFPSPEDRL